MSQSIQKWYQKVIDCYYRVLHCFRVFGAYALQVVGHMRSIDDHTILFYAFERKGICCNPKYIMKELIATYPEQYKLYWISRWPETCEKGKGYSVVRIRSAKFYYLCGYAKYVITNDRLDDFMIKRKGQIYINTWHGGGLTKKAAFDTAKNSDENIFFHNQYDKDDYIVSSSKTNAEILSKAFKIEKSHVLRTGMPRSDILYDRSAYLDVRKELKLDSNTKIVFYAPTYRKYSGNYYFPEEEIDNLRSVLNIKFGGEWLFLYKMHYFEEPEAYQEKTNVMLNCVNFYDTQKLLCGVDVLITDYSSLLWDFTLLNRPVFRYATDIDKYVDSINDFYLNYYKWPYPHASSVDDLYRCIEEYDTDRYAEEMREYLKKIGNYDDGNSSARFVEWLINNNV